MDIFADFSGLQQNRAKYTFVGFGLATEELQRCAEILATPIETLPIRYLGLPLTDRRLKTKVWKPVVEKVKKRLGGWRGKLLSRGGRLILVKAILSAIPTYLMSAFRMHRECHTEFFLAWGQPWKGRCPCCLELGVPAFH